MAKRARVSAGEVSGGLIGDFDLRRGLRRKSASRYYAATRADAGTVHVPVGPAFDDLTALVPALVPDAADVARRARRACELSDRSDAAKLLGEARSKLPAGIYRWAGRELAVDSAHRSRGSETESVSARPRLRWHGFTRRYAELGLA